MSTVSTITVRCDLCGVESLSDLRFERVGPWALDGLSYGGVAAALRASLYRFGWRTTTVEGRRIDLCQSCDIMHDRASLPDPWWKKNGARP